MLLIRMKNWFRKFSHQTSMLVGSPWAFALAIITIIIWSALGSMFHYSDTWQLVINTSTTIITFLMVFLIQNTQNRDAKAIHLKLDELIHATKNARNRLMNIEELSDKELNTIHAELVELKKDTEEHIDRILEVKDAKK